MYRQRTVASKRDSAARWHLPERVFFACGACHVLAYAFLMRYGRPGMKALWFKPAPGFTGNHVVVATERWVFDYHGYCDRQRYITHVNRTARRWWPGWTATLVELPADVLVSEAASRRYDGLWLREPLQFHHDALPRAEAFLDRFLPPDAFEGDASASDQRSDPAPR